jgi:hypothetical protein
MLNDSKNAIFLKLKYKNLILRFAGYEGLTLPCPAP